MRPDTLVAVTGATGHIGNNLVRALLARGLRVRAVVLAPTRALAGLDVEVAVADVRDPAALRAAFRGVDTVFHLAARIAVDSSFDAVLRAVNVEGAGNAAEAALREGVRRYVHMSSAHAFDLYDCDGVIDEGWRRPPPGAAAYDRSKAAGEDAVRAVIARGLDAVIVNPVGVVGPGDYEPSKMGEMLIGLARWRMPVTPPGGFHFADVRDVVASTIAAAERGRTGENYLLTGNYTPTAMVTRASVRWGGDGLPGPPVVPYGLLLGAAYAVATVARALGREARVTPEMVRTLRCHKHLSGAKAERELGHRTRSFDESARDQIAQFRAWGWIRGYGPFTVRPEPTSVAAPR